MISLSVPALYVADFGKIIRKQLSLTEVVATAAVFDILHQNLVSCCRDKNIQGFVFMSKKG